MCAIIGWSGKLPIGLLFQLMQESEFRGRDSTGIAYLLENGQNFTFKQAVTATQFIRINGTKIAEIQKSPQGIAHTRNASKGMPINNSNAHPFIFKSYVFAHNGKIQNWREIQAAHAAAKTGDAYENKFMATAATDSLLLGPMIEHQDFSEAIGSMGLAWLRGKEAYAFRSKKELTGAVVTWNYENSGESHKLLLVSSLWEIIVASLARTNNIRYDAISHPFEENNLYRFSSGEFENLGKRPTNSRNATDAYTSASCPIKD